jgi:hypothetical protein
MALIQLQPLREVPEAEQLGNARILIDDVDQSFYNNF